MWKLYAFDDKRFKMYSLYDRLKVNLISPLLYNSDFLDTR